MAGLIGMVVDISWWFDYGVFSADQIWFRRNCWYEYQSGGGGSSWSNDGFSGSNSSSKAATAQSIDVLKLDSILDSSRLVLILQVQLLCSISGFQLHLFCLLPVYKFIKLR